MNEFIAMCIFVAMGTIVVYHSESEEPNNVPAIDQQQLCIDEGLAIQTAPLEEF